MYFRANKTEYIHFCRNRKIECARELNVKYKDIKIKQNIRKQYILVLLWMKHCLESIILKNVEQNQW